MARDVQHPVGQESQVFPIILQYCKPHVLQTRNRASVQEKQELPI